MNHWDIIGLSVLALVVYRLGQSQGYYKAKSETVSDLVGELKEQANENEFFSIYLSTNRGDNGDDGDDDSEAIWEPTDPSENVRDWN